MTVRKVDSIFRDVVRDPDAATKHRINALESMARPSIRLLTQIAGDKNTPTRLRMVAIERLEVAVRLRRALEKLTSEEKHSGNEDNADDSDGAGHSPNTTGA